MSDILEIQGHCDSELDESDNVTQALKQTAKRRKGRGFMSCDSTLESIGAFEKLHQQDSARKRYPFQPQHSVEGWVVFVTGLHEEATEEDIRQLFSDYGRISNISLNLDRRTGYLKGYALIEYQSFDEAAKAVEYLDEKDLLGRAIRVNWCFTKGPNVIKRKHCK